MLERKTRSKKCRVQEPIQCPRISLRRPEKGRSRATTLSPTCSPAMCLQWDSDTLPGGGGAWWPMQTVSSPPARGPPATNPPIVHNISPVPGGRHGWENPLTLKHPSQVNGVMSPVKTKRTISITTHARLLSSEDETEMAPHRPNTTH